jgi:hypothetical protein
MQPAFELGIPQTLGKICDPTRLALTVYDIQVGIVKQIEKWTAHHGLSRIESFRFSQRLAEREFGLCSTWAQTIPRKREPLHS